MGVTSQGGSSLVPRSAPKTAQKTLMPRCILQRSFRQQPCLPHNQPEISEQDLALNRLTPTLSLLSFGPRCLPTSLSRKHLKENTDLNHRSRRTGNFLARQRSTHKPPLFSTKGGGNHSPHLSFTCSTNICDSEAPLRIALRLYQCYC